MGGRQTDGLDLQVKIIPLLVLKVVCSKHFNV